MTEETQLIPPKKTSEKQIWSLDCSSIPSYRRQVEISSVHISTEAQRQSHMEKCVITEAEEVGTIKDEYCLWGQPFISFTTVSELTDS